MPKKAPELSEEERASLTRELERMREQLKDLDQRIAFDSPGPSYSWDGEVSYDDLWQKTKSRIAYLEQQLGIFSPDNQEQQEGRQ